MSSSSSSKSTPHLDQKDPIDTYINLAQAATTPSQTRTIISQTLTHPRIHAGFLELLSIPSIALHSSPSDKNTLTLFAHGTYLEYINAPKGKYLELTPKQKHKLRQLSLVSLLSSKKSQVRVRYEDMRREIDFVSEELRTFEDFLIGCIYDNLFVGKMDQKTMCFICTGEVLSRDVKLEDVNYMIQKLEEWKGQSQVLLGRLEESGSKATRERELEAIEWKEVEEKVEEMKGKGSGNSSGRGMTAALPMGMMDVDYEAAGGGNRVDRKNKRSRGGVGGYGMDRGYRAA